MRTILIFLFLFLFAIISLPLYLIEFIIGKYNPKLKASSSQKIVVGAFHVMLFLGGTKITVIGRERIPDEAVLFVSNHRSYFDILLGYTTTTHQTGFISKKEISKVPCISHWMRYINCIFLDRDDPRKGLKSILQGIENVKNGISMYIMPEGTRNHEKEMLEFKPGSLKIAEKSGCPIVPVAMSNTDAIFELHSPWVRRAHTIIEYGEPIYVKSLDADQKKELLTHTRDAIHAMLERNDPNV